MPYVGINLLILLCDCMIQERDHVFIKRQTYIANQKAELPQQSVFFKDSEISRL